MLQAGAPPTLLVPPEQGALIGAVDAVQGSDAPALDELICLGAAPGVEVDRIVSIGQGGIVVPAERTVPISPAPATSWNTAIIRVMPPSARIS